MNVSKGRTTTSDISIFLILKAYMDSTSESSCNSVESTARTRFTRGISLKACVAKAAGWTLEKAKNLTLPEIKECKTT